MRPAETRWLFKPSPHVQRTNLMPDSVESGDESRGAVLLDRSTGIYHALNPAAAALWNVLANQPAGVTLDALTRALVQTQACPAARAQGDASAFLSDLETKNLIARVRAGGPEPS